MCKIFKAVLFAADKHKGQLRKYTNEPYFLHPLAVAQIIDDSDFNSKENVCAALLHDTVEDTSATIDDIKKEFGYDVAFRVHYLTDVSKQSDGPRAYRKEMDRNHLISCDLPDVFAIKCADLIHNTSSIVEHDPEFAKIYLAEKRLMLDDMAKARPGFAGTKLWKLADALC